MGWEEGYPFFGGMGVVWEVGCGRAILGRGVSDRRFFTKSLKKCVGTKKSKMRLRLKFYIRNRYKNEPAQKKSHHKIEITFKFL